MKARVKPTNNDKARVNQACWETILEAQTNANALMLIATIEYFQLGRKRILGLLNHYEDVEKEFSEYDAEGRFDEKLREALEYHGVDTSDLWQFETFDETTRRLKTLGKPEVSVAEARGIRQRYDGFKNLMEHIK